MKIDKMKSSITDEDIYNVRIGREDMLTDCLYNIIMEKVSDAIAKDIIHNHYNDILSKISPEAIANMAIAEAGAKINETLNKKLPDKIIEIEKIEKEVYQRGLFGGLSRIK